MFEHTSKSCPKQSRRAPLLLAARMAVGFIVLLTLGAAFGVLAGNELVLAGCAAAILSSLLMLLNRRQG